MLNVTIRGLIEQELLREAAKLFNRKLYFECHDLLEEAWTERRGEEKEFLQALIHLSVGMYHLATDNPKGARNLLSRSLEALSRYEPQAYGVDLIPLVANARICLEKAERALAGEAVEWEASDIPQICLTPAANKPSESN